ncbi:hypothetical protein [Persicobacter diffluens]|uniref:Uncharacterized protein n=1 Tax=Persicobacter diffluens TaxID=981 RepID=A0AAN4VWI8_9BACT|nr:hypothetical protein PEDI_19610 [Persicobacter diffluens]
MAREIPLQKGDVIFEKDLICISDGKATQRRVFLTVSVLWLSVLIGRIFYEPEAASLNFYFGVFLIHLLLVTAWSLTSSKHRIHRREIRTIQLKKYWFGGPLQLSIQLRWRRRRNVNIPEKERDQVEKLLKEWPVNRIELEADE